MTTGRFYIVLGIGLVTAGAVWAQSSVIVNQLRAPDRAALIGLPPQGWVKASQSHALQTARLMKEPGSVPRDLEIRLAKAAFATEPLARAAWPVLVQSLAITGQQRESDQLLQLAGSLSRRENLLNAMMIDRALKKGEAQRALRLLGQAMSVDYGVQRLYLKRMAAGTADPGAKDVLIPLLGRNPNWAAGYWAAVIEEAAALRQAGEIRLDIAGSPWRNISPAATDYVLIANLANQNEQDLAYRLARALGLRSESGGEVLTGSTFDRQPRFIPFEWELIQTGDIGAMIDAKAKVLSISSLPASAGVVARQMVRIQAPGQYRLRWKLTGLATAPDASLKLRLTCAQANLAGASIPPVSLGEGEGSKIVDVAPSACGWYMATLELDAPDGNVGTDIMVQRLSLRRDSGVADSRPVRPNRR